MTESRFFELDHKLSAYCCAYVVHFCAMLFCTSEYMEWNLSFSIMINQCIRYFNESSINFVYNVIHTVNFTTHISNTICILHFLPVYRSILLTNCFECGWQVVPLGKSSFYSQKQGLLLIPKQLLYHSSPIIISSFLQEIFGNIV